MYLTTIFIELIKIFSPVVIAYTFCVIFIDVVVRGFRGL